MTNCIFCNKRIPTSVGIAIIVLIALLFGAILAWQYWWVPKEEGGVPEIGQYTSWIKDLITKEENEPVANPPALLTRCEYNNKIVYYLPPRCCDAESILFDEKGDVICAPDGGFTGKGDGRCPDFFEERKNCEVIWKDARSYPDETAGWQTYRNEEYGFEIKYPDIFGSPWGVYEISDQNEIYRMYNTRLTQQYPNIPSSRVQSALDNYKTIPTFGGLYIGQESLGAISGITIRVFGNPKYLSLDQWLQLLTTCYNYSSFFPQNDACPLPYCLCQPGRSINIRDMKEIYNDKYKITNAKSDIPESKEMGWPGGYMNLFFLEYNDKIYAVGAKGPENDSLISQILSTFRFIDPIDAFGWRTHRDEQYGFEFKYQENYITSLFASGKSPEVIIVTSLEDIADSCFYKGEQPEYFYKDFENGKFIANNITFCVTKIENAGAGSVFPTYYYATLVNDKYVILKFDITYQSCMGYEASPKLQECANFSKNISRNIEKPIEKIVSSFKLLE